MAEPILRRLWNTVKPPPAVKGPKKPMTAQRRKQRKMILATLGVVVIGGAGWGIYAYIAASPQRAKSQFDAAMLLMGSGKYEKAVDGFTHAIQIWPQYAEAYVERGISNHFLKQDELALADLDTAVQLNPSLFRAFNARGGIFRDRGDIKRAMDEYAKSIQAQPNVDAFFERGQIYEKLGQHQRSDRRLRQRHRVSAHRATRLPRPCLRQGQPGRRRWRESKIARSPGASNAAKQQFLCLFP